jgi:hypothetical protein
MNNGNKKNISALENAPRQDARIPCADVDPRRAHGIGAPSQSRPQADCSKRKEIKIAVRRFF